MENKKVTLLGGIGIKLIIAGNILLFLLLALLRRSPQLVEKLYFAQLYRVSSFIMGRITDMLTISLSELLIGGLILTIPVNLAVALFLVVSKKRALKSYLIPAAREIIIVSSIIIGWFYLMWGINYLRPPLVERNRELFNKESFSDAQFNKALLFFIERSNTLYTENSYSLTELNEIVDREIFLSSKELSGIELHPARKVKRLVSGMLAKRNVLGVVSPFLLESHISRAALDSELPFLIAHEKAHLYGFAHETEANFAAFHSCVRADNRFLNYSAYSEMLDYMLPAYRRHNSKEEYNRVYNLIRPEIQAVHKAKRERYERYNSRLNDRFWELYDLYLKANKVEEGNVAYSRVVEMVLKTELLDHLMTDASVTYHNQ